MRQIHPKQPKRLRVKPEAQRDREARQLQRRVDKINAARAAAWRPIPGQSYVVVYPPLTEEPTNDR